MNQITIIIPNYNGANFLKECLEALYTQENAPGYTVLVVDNGSKDGSLELLKERFPQASVIALPENTGFCHAVNLGIEASDTPYVILLNNDTKAYPGFARALYDAVEADPSLFSVSARMLMWDKPELLDGAGDRYCVLGWAYSRGKGKPAVAYSQAVEIFSACGGAAIYRKSVFEKIGLFDEAHFAYLEDLDIGYRARIHGYRNYYEPSANVIHYGSASTGSRYNEWKTVRAAANSVYVIAKNMPLLQIIWNLPFLFAGFFIKFLFFCKKGMGKLYLKGLAEGIKKSFSETGRARKTPFHWENLGNYLAIQGQLYLNLLRILKKS
nr:glycosyltransferase family 2 protein [uncultured Acetatifactor sp.]